MVGVILSSDVVVYAVFAGFSYFLYGSRVIWHAHNHFLTIRPFISEMDQVTYLQLAVSTSWLKTSNRIDPMSHPFSQWPQFSAFESKMRSQGLSQAAIAAFKSNYDQLVAGVTGLVPEGSITPVTDLPYLSGMAQAAPHTVKVGLWRTCIMQHATMSAWWGRLVELRP